MEFVGFAHLPQNVCERCNQCYRSAGEPHTAATPIVSIGPASLGSFNPVSGHLHTRVCTPMKFNSTNTRSRARDLPNFTHLTCEGAARDPNSDALREEAEG